MFGGTDDNVLCKYEGEWDRDKRSGEGLCLFPDKSMYMGAFYKNLREGDGKLIWPNGDSYEGSWKTERMNGSGTFTQSSGGVLSGNYKDNFYQVAPQASYKINNNSLTSLMINFLVLLRLKRNLRSFEREQRISSALPSRLKSKNYSIWKKQALSKKWLAAYKKAMLITGSLSY